MPSKGLEKWRKGVTKNRSGDKANAFGLAESIGRTNKARALNYDSGTFDKMKSGMDAPKFDEGAAANIIKNQVSKPRNKVPTGRPSSAGLQNVLSDFPPESPTNERNKYAK